MKVYSLETQNILDTLFEYPMVDPNSDYLSGKKIVVFTGDNDNLKSTLDLIKAKGADIVFDTQENAGQELYGGVIFPPIISKKEKPEDAYYKILEHYIFNAQWLIKRMKPNNKFFRHILIILPAHADEYSTELDKMAYYAVYGFVKGLAKMYGPNAIFVNGLMLNDNESYEMASDWASFLISTNANNIIGEIIKL